MKIEQRKWTEAKGWGSEPLGRLESVQLVLMFGARSILRKGRLLDEVKSAYPGAHLFGCSTAGEICGPRVSDNTLVVTAVNFEHTRLRGAQIRIDQMTAAFQAGECLAQAIPKALPSLTRDGEEKLAHVLVVSDGLRVNGSDLVRGLTKHLTDPITVTGGLAGDGERFEETLVFWDDAPASDRVAVIGLYGSRLRVGYGSMGGWDSFGPERLITRSFGNVLYELDGRSALELYKKYLGKHAKGLPATALLFPLVLRIRTGETGVVRTVLSVNEKEQSLTFAGDMPEGAYARLMKANFDRLIDGAIGAAETSYQAAGSISPDLAVLISCVGRKLVLRQRTEEEVEGVRQILGKRTVLTGFYSYGEISPFRPGSQCELHNQTMSITTFKEE